MLSFLVIAALLGFSLRLIHAGVISANFKHILHTHSHIVLLGWLYNAVVVILQYSIFKKEEGPMNRIFWLSQLTFLGMMLSFPFQGYAFASITFSTLYLFCSYALVYYLFKYSKTVANKNVGSLIKWSGVYLVLSSFGPFSLGFIMAKGLGDTFWFNLSIYWFLHFLYNGFFALIVFAFILSRIKSENYQKLISRLMIFSVLPLYGLSVLWLSPNNSVYVIAFLGALFQFVAFALLLANKGLKSLFTTFWPKTLLKLAMVSYGLKMIFQVASVLPFIQDFLTETVSYAVIGFIHLVMLGFFTLFVLAVFIESQWIKISREVSIGLICIILGILLSESFLFGQSIAVFYSLHFMPNYFEWLAAVSSLMPIGFALLLWMLFKK
tara:strand:+ start:108416 stop:109558 length:1143 start_codon:yes stop_codon:yes gene_type:complete